MAKETPTMVLPTPEAFCLEKPLYVAFPYSVPTDTLYLEFFQGTLDTFCVECQKESVFLSLAEMPTMPPISRQTPFRRIEDIITSGQAIFQHSDGSHGLALTTDYAATPRNFILSFICPRTSSHLLSFVFRVTGLSVVKIGQYPSLKDLQEYSLRKYRGVLPNEDYLELSTALGLASHGVGIGSFVYLRRVFERVLERAHMAATEAPGWDETTYGPRVEDKILSLKAFLPLFLVENRKVYAILSRGLHELTEEECKEYFTPLFGAISLMLDQWLEQERRGKREKEIAAAIEKIHHQLRDDSGATSLK